MRGRGGETDKWAKGAEEDEGAEEAEVAEGACGAEGRGSKWVRGMTGLMWLLNI